MTGNEAEGRRENDVNVSRIQRERERETLAKPVSDYSRDMLSRRATRPSRGCIAAITATRSPSRRRARVTTHTYMCACTSTRGTTHTAEPRTTHIHARAHMHAHSRTRTHAPLAASQRATIARARARAWIRSCVRRTKRSDLALNRAQTAYEPGRCRVTPSHSRPRPYFY